MNLVDAIKAEIDKVADIIKRSAHGRLEITWKDGLVVGITPAPHFRRERPTPNKPPPRALDTKRGMN